MKTNKKASVRMMEGQSKGKFWSVSAEKKGMTLLNQNNGDGISKWRRMKLTNGLFGIRCMSLYKSSIVSSEDLVKDCTELIKKRWPGEWLYVHSDERIFSSEVIKAFKSTGWKECGATKKNLIILGYPSTSSF